MSPDEIKGLRARLGFSQAHLASLLGVHTMTVSKWERGALTATPHQDALLRAFRSAAETNPEVGKLVIAALVGAGIATALFLLLKASQ